jgi:modulator of FtsH protease HflK
MKYYIICFLIFIFCWTSFYIVNPDEEAIIVRFGAYVRHAYPGLNIKFPYPVEKIWKVQVAKVYRMDIALNNAKDDGILTGDENIVHGSMVILWQIKDAKKFLINTTDPEMILETAAESCMREMVGQTNIGPLVSGSGWGEINSSCLELLQSLMDKYDIGIKIVNVEMQRALPPHAVSDAFTDVQRAKADEARMINEAKAYKNDLIPKTTAKCIKKINEAEAQKASDIKEAEGLVSKWEKMSELYSKDSEIVKETIYWDMMKEILSNSENKIITQKGMTNLLPYSSILNSKDTKETEEEKASSKKKGE